MYFLGVFLLGALIFVGAFLSRRQDVDYYYLSRTGSSTTAICVYNHWRWHVDELVFCSDDPIKAIAVLHAANEEVGSRK